MVALSVSSVTLRAAMTLMRLCVLGVVFCAIVGVANCRTFKPARSYFKPCSRRDADSLNACVASNFASLKPRLSKGIRGLDMVPLEPLVFPRIELEEKTCNFKLTKILTNATIHGLTNYTVRSVNFTMNDSRVNFQLDLWLPHLRMTSHYDLDGVVLLLPVIGRGECQVNFTDVNMTATTQGNVVTREGQQYIDLDEVKWNIKVNESRSHFDNLFGGNKELGKEANRFLNENWRDAFNTYKEVPEEALRLIFKDFSSKVFGRYSIKELFVD